MHRVANERVNECEDERSNESEMNATSLCYGNMCCSSSSDQAWYEERLRRVKDEADEVEATLECRISTLEAVNQQLEENKEALVERVKDLELEVRETSVRDNESRDKLSKVSEALDRALNDVQYYHARMDQEKKLSRQLMLQVEELQKRRPLLEDENKDRRDQGSDEEHKENVIPSLSLGEHTDGSTDSPSLPVPARTREACVVCTEVCDYYESMPCRHPICTECYVQWFASRMYYNDTRRDGEPPVVFACPMCRTPIDTQ